MLWPNIWGVGREGEVENLLWNSFSESKSPPNKLESAWKRERVNCGRGRSSLYWNSLSLAGRPSWQAIKSSSAVSQAPLIQVEGFLSPQCEILWLENTVLAQAKDSMNKTESYGSSLIHYHEQYGGTEHFPCIEPCAALAFLSECLNLR